jgi:ubiquinol-cytochrome c reductase cytochrome c subunit
MKKKLILVLTLVSAPALAQETPHGDAKHGQALYESSGCFECHGYGGVGSSQGPHLITPAPFDRFLRQLRVPAAVMPPYEAGVLSDADVADIYAYLRAQPKPPDPATVKLLN